MMTKKEEQLYQERLKKLEALRKAGVNLYPAQTSRSHIVSQVLDKFSSLAQGRKEVVLAGRVRAIRIHGGLAFGDLEDGSGKLQFLLKKDEIGSDDFDLFTKYLDIGDFVEIKGTLGVTKQGEKTLHGTKFRLLAKSLRPLPDKWHGLTDTELKLRKRYLELLTSPSVRELFVKKSEFWQTVREFMVKEGFLEVQTPVLEAIPGGADAEPFITHHNALDRDFYLRISLELPLKRLLVGGYEKVFEIGRLFRNEGIDREHLQEYDDMEFYWAYADAEAGMAVVQKLYQELVKKATGGYETVFDGQKIVWNKKWPKVDYFELFKNETGIDLNRNVTVTELKKKADSLGVKYDKSYGVGRMIDVLYKKTIRPKFIQPCFLVGHPIDISPLAKTDSKHPRKVDRFQILIAGSELGNGWSELNDPLDQRKRLEEQMKLREAGDKEAQMLDEDYIEALEYGMPPAVGFGMSERVFSVMMNKSIRETVIFPPLRGKND